MQTTDMKDPDTMPKIDEALAQAKELNKEFDEKAAEEGSAVDHPAHYNVGKIEVIDYIEDQGIGEDFYAGNVLKYVSRYKHKGAPAQDLEKARFYLNRLIRLLEKSQGS
jgi:hypothetical protein